MVSRHTRLKGRVVESAGIRSYRERSGPDRWHNPPGVDGVVADKTQTHCPRLERLVPKVLKNRKCLDTYELLNKSARFNFRHDGALGMLEGSCGKARLIAS